MGRDRDYPLGLTTEGNLIRLLEAVNRLRTAYGKPMYVSSGYRPGPYNEAARGSKNSAHITCEAVDFVDVDGELKKFCTIERLEQFGLWMEHPDSTPTWCHVDIRVRANRIFRP